MGITDVLFSIVGIEEREEDKSMELSVFFPLSSMLAGRSSMLLPRTRFFSRTRTVLGERCSFSGRSMFLMFSSPRSA